LKKAHHIKQIRRMLYLILLRRLRCWGTLDMVNTKMMEFIL